MTDNDREILVSIAHYHQAQLETILERLYQLVALVDQALAQSQAFVTRVRDEEGQG